MSTLDTLIRLHRWHVDEHRRRVAEFEQLVEKLRAELTRLTAEQANEQDFVQRSEEIAYSYGAYAGAMIERRRKLEQSLVEAERQTAQAREKLAEVYQEAKRYEIASARRLLNQRRQAERIEQQNMDELGIDIHRRAQGRRPAQR
jgi:flagellar protein FliJ